MARTNDITAIGQRESFFIYCLFDRINKYQLVFLLISTNENYNLLFYCILDKKAWYILNSCLKKVI